MTEEVFSVFFKHLALGRDLRITNGVQTLYIFASSKDMLKWPHIQKKMVLTKMVGRLLIGTKFLLILFFKICGYFGLSKNAIGWGVSKSRNINGVDNLLATEKKCRWKKISKEFWAYFSSILAKNNRRLENMRKFQEKINFQI